MQTGDHVSTTSSLLQSAERLIAPIQTPLSAGTSVQEQPTGGFTSTFNSANPTFAVLKATAFQQALGHPMAYARVLMQVKYLKKKQNLFEYLFFRWDMNHYLHIEEKLYLEKKHYFIQMFFNIVR